ncbi:MAG: nucleotidyltransferase family protein [Deltaproteobacteria bacterium]
MSYKRADVRSILSLLRKNGRVLSSYGVKKIGVFGSVAKGAAGKKSDIDVLVELKKETFDNYMDLKFFLEDAFGRKVDLVLSDGLKPELAERILEEIVYA